MRRNEEWWTYRNAWRAWGGDADENSWVRVNAGDRAKVHRSFVAVVNNSEKEENINYLFFILLLNLLPSLSTDGSWKVFICLNFQNEKCLLTTNILSIYLNWRMVRSTGNFSSASGLFTLTWNCKDRYQVTDGKSSNLKYMSLRISLKGGDLALRHLELEEELDRLGDTERVAVVEAASLHPGLHHNLARCVHLSHCSCRPDWTLRELHSVILFTFRSTGNFNLMKVSIRKIWSYSMRVAMQEMEQNCITAHQRPILGATVLHQKKPQQ